jgi:hypothetical protein
MLWYNDFDNLFLKILLGVKETDLPFQSNREIRAFEYLLSDWPPSEVEVDEESAEMAILWRVTHRYKESSATIPASN